MESRSLVDTGLSQIRKAWPQPLTGAVNARTRERVVEAFPVLSGCGHDAFLALGKYLDGTPERFYAADACQTYADFLENQMSSDSARLARLLDEHADDIDRAILTLNEVCAEDWHDTEMEREEYAFMRLCDRSLHPAYLTPDISGSTIERVGIHRIAWNKAWLDSQPQSSE